MKSTMQSTPLLISDLFDYGTTVHADSKCITWTPDGGRETTYGELGAEGRRLANALRGLGVDGDQRVATFMWNNAEHFAAYLAVPSMGAVLHALNIRLFPEQLIYVGNHGGSEVVIVDNTLAEPFSKLLAHLPKIRHVIVNGPIDDAVREALAAPEGVEKVHDWTELLADQSDEFEWPKNIDEDDASSMCYTSGTTGNPKGVAYSHRSNVLHAMGSSMTVSLGPQDTSLVVVPLFHANAWGYPYAAMLSGVSLLMPDRFLQPEPLTDMIEQVRPTFGAGVPTIWNGLLQYQEATGRDISSLRQLLSGGSACPPDLMKAYQTKGITVLQGWGMTETSPLASVALEPPHEEVGTDEYWKYRVSQGRIVGGMQARVVGPDGELQPWDGEAVGEIEVRGPWVTGSYFSNGTESEGELADMASKFDDGWLRTGDVGSMTRDGYILLSDRAKDVIKSGGEWISSVDLENHLMGHPAVAEASVIGVPDDKWGERPLAAVVIKPGQQVSMEELRDFIADRVARWQVPERWAIIDEVPKTSVGKFDKKQLRSRYAAQELEVAKTDAPVAG